MAKPECRWESPQDWAEWSEWLAGGLHGRNRWRLPVLLSGILFARGRRTVTTWLRAAGISTDYADYYYFLAALGRKTESVATRLWCFANMIGTKKAQRPRLLEGIFPKLASQLTCAHTSKRSFAKVASSLTSAAERRTMRLTIRTVLPAENRKRPPGKAAFSFYGIGGGCLAGHRPAR